MPATHSRRDLLTAGLLGLVGFAATPAARATPAVPGEAVRWPELSLLDGPRLSAGQLARQAVVVVFFSTTCAYCRRHNRHLDRLVRERTSDGLRVIGVAHDRDPQLVRQHMREQGYAFDVTLDAAPLHAALSERRITPLTCVVDRTGRLREVIPGEMFEDDVLDLARWAQA